MNGFNKDEWHSPRVLLGILVAFCFSGCGGGTEQASSLDGTVKTVEVAQLHYEITAQGEGPQSQLPMDPLEPGQLLLDSGSRAYSRAVTGPITIGKIEVMESWHSTGFATFQANTDHGLVRYGDDKSGITIEAVLLAPKTLRVGMKWTTAGREFEVLQRVEEPTAWGLRPVWTIADKELGKDLVECTRVYVEGHGLRQDTCLSSAMFDAAIELLEPLIPPGNPEPIQVAPLKVAGIQWGIPLGAQHLWGVDIDPGHSPMVVSVFGEANPRLLYGYVEEDVWSCLQVEPNGDIYERHPAPIFADLLNGDVTVVRGPPTCPWGEFHEGQWDYLGNRHAVRTWMRSDGSGGVWYGTSRSDGTLQGKDGHLVGDTMLALVGWEGDGEPTAIHWNYFGGVAWDALEPLVGQVVGGGPTFALTPPQAVEETLPVGLVTASGLLTNTTLAADGTTGRLEMGPYFGPFYTVRATPAQRDVVMVSPGGNVDRMVLGEQGWQRQPLASVALPFGHSGFVGAFAIPGLQGAGERLLLFTRVFPPWTFTFDDGTAEETVQPMTLAWTAPIPEKAPVRPWLGALAVTAEKIGADVRVCWPAAGEPEVEGWTLGGAPPQQVVPHFDNHQCVALFRAHSAAVAADEPGGMVVEGPVPGVGRVRVAMTPGAGESTDRDFAGGAPLTGGGFAATNGIFGAGGVVVEPMLLNAPYAEYYDDSGGHGLWYWVKGTNEMGLHLVNKEGDANLFGPVGGTLMARPYGGGLVIWNELDHCRRFHPDGTVETIPDICNKLYNVGYLSDGRACGNGYDGASEYKESLYCYSADGEETLVSQDPAHSLGTGGNAPFFPVADRYFLMGNYTGVWLLDADEGTVAPYADATQLANVVYAADRTLYGQVDGVWSELGPTGPIPLELADYAEQVQSLYVDEHVLILLLLDGTSARLPR